MMTMMAPVGLYRGIGFYRFNNDFLEHGYSLPLYYDRMKLCDRFRGRNGLKTLLVDDDQKRAEA